MYNDLIFLLKQKYNVLFINNNNNHYASNILQLILSNISIKNADIIDSKNQINFVKRNLQLDESVNLYGYDTSEEFLRITNQINSNKKQHIVIQKDTNNTLKHSGVFDYRITVNNKSNYVIKTNYSYIF